jgi:hypothetical protein
LHSPRAARHQRHQRTKRHGSETLG